MADLGKTALGSVAHTTQFPVVMLYEEAAELVEVRFNPDDPVETRTKRLKPRVSGAF